MTLLRKGVDGLPSPRGVVAPDKRVTVDIGAGRGCSEMGVEGNTPILLDRSSLRISFVASIPSMTGSWISIYVVSTAGSGRYIVDRTRIK